MRIPITSIICTTDFSDSSIMAVPYGIALAKEFGAKLYLAHVVDLSSAIMYGDAIMDLQAQISHVRGYSQEKLNEIMGDQSVEWEPLIGIGHVGHEIIRMAKETGANLVISATHGRSGFQRLILGSVTDHLMRMLPCPLWVVRGLEKEKAVPLEREIRLHRILIGCDFSPHSERAFQYGLSLAQEFQSELHLVHVVEPTVYKHFTKPAQKPEEELHENVRNLFQKELTDMVPEEARHWCTPKTALLAGQPYEELTKYAMLNSMDLIVLGVRGHGLVETLFVGSTTDRVVRQALCPVLSVPPSAIQPA